MIHTKNRRCLCLLLALAVVLGAAAHCRASEKIGVLYVLHGGMDEYRDQYLWHSSVHTSLLF